MLLSFRHRSKRMWFIFLWMSLSAVCQAQYVEAVNEDATRHRRFRLKQGVECELDINDRPVILRGKLIQIDTAGFKLELGKSYYTNVPLSKLIRIRHHRYTRQRVASAGIGANLLGPKISSQTFGSASLVALSALTGLGIALAKESSTFRRKDPSIYHGWSFQTYP